LGGLAPVLVAALATEEPLLLIGPHGTAKSLLLTSVASALGLRFRHYNASLLNFDDLIGFPLPDKGGQLSYVQTPATIWGAGAVIFDEISRCRPDIQNKLFSIIHERKVQGLPLAELRYRWAAMNPPARDGDDGGYLGSEALDAALVDRFTFIVSMPSWAELTEAEQLAVIQAEHSAIDPDAGASLAQAISSTRAAIPAVRLAVAERLALYVRTVVALLQQSGVALSPRRAAMIFRSATAVQAAAAVINPTMPPADATLLTLVNSLPQRANEATLPHAKILAVHREAWRLAGVNANDPLRAILTIADPVEKLRLAIAAPTLSRDEVSTIVADALTQMPVGARDAAIAHVFSTGAVGRLHAAVAEEFGDRYRSIATSAIFSEAMHTSDCRFATWTRIKDLIARLDPHKPEAHLQANALAAAFSRKEITTPQRAEEAFLAFSRTFERLHGATP
jgi:MoxR-like ATPase